MKLLLRRTLVLQQTIAKVEIQTSKILLLILLSKIQNVQVSDTTGDNSSTTVGNKKIIIHANNNRRSSLPHRKISAATFFRKTKRSLVERSEIFTAGIRIGNSEFG